MFRDLIQHLSNTLLDRDPGICPGNHVVASDLGSTALYNSSEHNSALNAPHDPDMVMQTLPVFIVVADNIGLTGLSFRCFVRGVTVFLVTVGTSKDNNM